MMYVVFTCTLGVISVVHLIFQQALTYSQFVFLFDI